MAVGLFVVGLTAPGTSLANEEGGEAPKPEPQPAAAEPAQPPEPFDPAELLDKLDDRAYDRYVDLGLLGKAWEDLDASLMADVGLGLREGERVLLRPHKAVRSEQVLQLAIRLAVQQNDRQTLERLKRALPMATRAIIARRSLVGLSPEARAVSDELRRVREQVARAILEKEQAPRALFGGRLKLGSPRPTGPSRAQRIAELTQQKEQLERKLAELSEPFRRRQQMFGLEIKDLAALFPPGVAQGGLPADALVDWRQSLAPPADAEEGFTAGRRAASDRARNLAAAVAQTEPAHADAVTRASAHEILAQLAFRDGDGKSCRQHALAARQEYLESGSLVDWRQSSG